MTLSNSDEVPRVTLDLKLYPPAVDHAYWSDHTRNAKLKQQDSQVALFWWGIVVALHINYSKKQGMDHFRLLSVFSVATGFLSVWLLLLYVAPSHIYTRHRLVIIAIVRFLMGWTAHQTTADTRDMLHTSLILNDPFWTYATKIFLIAPPPMKFIEASILQLPYTWQAAAVLYKEISLMVGAMAVAFVHWANTPDYLSAAEQMNIMWAMLVQPTGATTQPPQHPRLTGRSTAVLLSWCTMYVTETAVTLWAVYIFQWLGVRGWLQRKCAEGTEHSGWRATSPHQILFINGVAVSKEQLCGMHSTKAASVLLKPSGGFGGMLLLVCLHALILGVICQASLLASQGLVFQLMPDVLPESWFEQFYPLAPAAA